MIQSLAEKGDIMDAAVLSTQLIGPECGLPTPLTPEQTPEKNILCNASDTEKQDTAVSKQMQVDQVRFYEYNSISQIHV